MFWTVPLKDMYNKAEHLIYLSVYLKYAQLAVRFNTHCQLQNNLQYVALKKI